MLVLTDSVKSWFDLYRDYRYKFVYFPGIGILDQVHKTLLELIKLDAIIRFDRHRLVARKSYLIELCEKKNSSRSDKRDEGFIWN